MTYALRTTIALLGLALACAGWAGVVSADDSLLTNGKKFYSQHNEELIIRHFFDDRENGFFLDVGCFKWRQLSTTYYLEEHLGWKGIGIDANDALEAGYLRHRPNTKFMNYLVTDKTGPPGTFYLALGSEGISSADDAWITKFYGAFFPKKKARIREVTVPTISLNDLLDQEGVTKIDFLSMDIEGHEPKALAGFDIERFRPELVCIEWRGNEEVISAYFESHGYRRIDKYLEYDQANWYFTPKKTTQG
jgi:FkbM family methyltransferase